MPLGLQVPCAGLARSSTASPTSPAVGLLAALLCAAAFAGCSEELVEPAAPSTAPADGSRSFSRFRVTETNPMRIDGIYASMQGPYDQVPLDVTDLDWVTSLRTEVVDAETGEKLDDELFCHSQLQQLNATRLMVTATGSEEIRFPEGFAMPVTQILGGLPVAERQLSLLGMVLNNHVPEMDRDVRVRATIEYLTDEDTATRRISLKKLYKVGLAMSVRHLSEIETAEGLFRDIDANAKCVSMPGYDTHWMVPPGPQKTRMRWWNFLPIDATVHYAVVHLHNYGVYFRFTDVTAGEVLWQADVINEPDRMQIARIPVYSSEEGFPVFKDHEYEIEAYYENTTDHDIDAMASIYLYYHPERDVAISYPTGPSHVGG